MHCCLQDRRGHRWVSCFSETPEGREDLEWVVSPITTMAAISLAGSPVAACDASEHAEPNRTQRFPVGGDSDGLKDFAAQLQRYHSSLHFRDRQRKAERPPADARARSCSQRCYR